MMCLGVKLTNFTINTWFLFNMLLECCEIVTDIANIRQAE